jgi:hypothetical protein
MQVAAHPCLDMEVSVQLQSCRHGFALMQVVASLPPLSSASSGYDRREATYGADEQP